MAKNNVVTLSAFRKDGSLDNNRQVEPRSMDTSSCSLCPYQLEQSDAVGQCCTCREAQQAALRAYGLRDDLEDDWR